MFDDCGEDEDEDGDDCAYFDLFISDDLKNGIFSASNFLDNLSEFEKNNHGIDNALYVFSNLFFDAFFATYFSFFPLKNKMIASVIFYFKIVFLNLFFGLEEDHVGDFDPYKKASDVSIVVMDKDNKERLGYFDFYNIVRIIDDCKIFIFLSNGDGVGICFNFVFDNFNYLFNLKVKLEVGRKLNPDIKMVMIVFDRKSRRVVVCDDFQDLLDTYLRRINGDSYLNPNYFTYQFIINQRPLCLSN